MQSEEERRAKNAEKQRRYRERRREAREAEKAAAGNADNGPVPTTMRDSVESALSAAKWLTDADGASRAQARALAKQVDVLEHAGETTRLLSAHRALSQVLNDLGATATKRLQYELRSQRSTDAEVPDGEVKRASGDAIVSELKRPAKRRRS